MTRRPDRLTTAVAIFLAILAAVIGGANARPAHAAGTQAPKRASNSLTTQFPLGGHKLCCASKPRRQATKPTRRPSTASQTTSVTSTAAAVPSPRSRTATASQTPLLGSRSGSATGPLIAIAVVILGGAAAVLIGLLSVRRRQRARRTARAGSATPGAPPAVSRPDAARPADSVPRPKAAPRSDEAPPRPAPVEWRRARSRAPVVPDLQPPPAVAGPAEPDRVPQASDAADENMIADPLARLERELLEQGDAAAAAPGPRQSQPGEGAYRLGQVLYERGRLHEAAVAWRLAASKQHPEAVSRLADLLEQSGGTARS